MTTLRPVPEKASVANTVESYQTSSTRAYMVVDVLPGAETVVLKTLSRHPSVESVDVVEPQCLVLVMRGDDEDDLVEGVYNVMTSVHPWASFVELSPVIMPA